MKDFIWGIPKAELHVHVEGTLEPELMLDLAAANAIELPYRSVEEARAAYCFDDLQSFLDIYYAGTQVLRRSDDFFALAWAYLQRAAAQNVRHVELMFDPQAHTGRGVAFGAVFEGLTAALDRARAELGISSHLVMSFLRHLSAEHAMATLEQARPYVDRITAVGLDSSERGHPPAKFREVFDACRRLGLRPVAHAGEEGPPDYISQALDLLGAERIDHGVRCLEDAEVVARLADERTPLTVCPLSNVKLRVFDSMDDHSLLQLMEAGLVVTVNSDDPAYFGGYVAENLLAVQQSFGLSAGDVARLARHSFEASFLEADERAALLSEVDAFEGAG